MTAYRTESPPAEELERRAALDELRARLQITRAQREELAAGPQTPTTRALLELADMILRLGDQTLEESGR